MNHSRVSFFFFCFVYSIFFFDFVCNQVSVDHIRLTLVIYRNSHHINSFLSSYTVFARHLSTLLFILVICFFIFLQVSWIRKRDLHILTAGVLTYTSDERFQVCERPLFSFYIFVRIYNMIGFKRVRKMQQKNVIHITRGNRFMFDMLIQQLCFHCFFFLLSQPALFLFIYC